MSSEKNKTLLKGLAWLVLQGVLGFTVFADTPLFSRPLPGTDWKKKGLKLEDGSNSKPLPGARRVRGASPTTVPGSGTSTRGTVTEVFRIGKKDQSFLEFDRKRKASEPLIYRVGKDSPTKEKDWPAYQPGSFENLLKEPEGVPFQIIFSLAAAPQGKFVLHLDTIVRYRQPAAPRYAVEINGHAGSYQLRPRPAPELWWPTGGSGPQFVGYESLDMLLPASYFRRGENTLTVRCPDGYGIYYDALSLTNEPEGTVPMITGASVQPTIFYKQRDSQLVELADVILRTTQPIPRTSLRVVIGSTQIKKEISQSGFGDLLTTVEVPAPETPLPVALYVGGARAPVYQGTFQPQRRWRVYAAPRAQHNYGFNEVPARTLEWQNRYIDKFLDILQEYSSYSFTVDVSANLESYLETRVEAQRKQLLDYLRNGKVGINAFWMNFFTGLATPEELFQMLEYALRAGKQYGFTVDEASQTDEPTLTWAFPQILAEAGVKYLSNGSNPFRGPFLPLGQMNLQSPFYWEGPNGSKVLTWLGSLYVVVRDLTWDGWNPEDARLDKEDPDRFVGCWNYPFNTCEDVKWRGRKYTPSLFGLQRSLPLFLSQYDRQDYPFDAVLLYGLENDEFPIRHFGSADIIERWNQEYAYPKVIPGIARDYFRYITEHFGSQIRTYRGDAGASWEEEAGADARVAAMNRTSQIQVTAAEKLESIATWLQPLIRYDHARFREAWKNIMLTDNYVWSDGGAIRRPSSYLTQVNEGNHRGWAETAYRKTRDLLTVAMDKIAELIQTDKRGVVVFNVDSQPRSDFFDWELELDEAPQDPETGQPLPCGLLKEVEGYQKVRCWAADVPALGYRFYPVVRGRVPSGEVVPTSVGAATIEGKYYSLRLDPETGAVSQLIDKETGQDLVNSSSGYKLNEYLYVTGGDLPPPKVWKNPPSNRLLTADPTLDVPVLTINRQTLVGTPQIAHFPWGTLVTIRARATNTPEIVTTITLNDQQKRVAFQNVVEKIPTLNKEAVYFAFPFAVESPRAEYQGGTAWVNPETDMLPGATRQFFVTQGGVRIEGANQSVGWVSVDAPLITLEDINRGLWPDSIKIHSGTVFSYIMNNYFIIDTPGQQGGHFTFRYVLTSGPNLPLSAMTRLSTRARSPLYAVRHYHKEWKQILPERGIGFLSTLPDGLAILTIRPGSDDHTYIVRVHNSTDQRITARLQFPVMTVEGAHLGSVLGDPLKSVEWAEHEVRFPMNKYDIKTLVVRLKPSQD